MPHWTSPLAAAALILVASPGTAQIVTYDDIAPILNAHCVACHRPDGIGPFSLTTYDDARAQAQRVADAVERRLMPPWLPTPGYGRFQGSPALEPAEIDLLTRWAEAGAAEGDAAGAPSPPAVEPWPLGEPDLVLTPDTGYPLPPGTTDVYRNLVVPTGLTDTRWVTAVVLGPASPRVVHQARLLLDTTGQAREADASDELPGYDGHMLDHAGFPDGHVPAWRPGRAPTLLPDALAWPLPPGSDLVVQLRLRPGPVETVVRPVVGLYFADTPPPVAPMSIVLHSTTIDIPAGAADHAVTDRFLLPVPVDVVGVYAHAHHLGRSVDAVATVPEGTEVPLLRIDDWDVDWQEEYRYASPVHLPAESVVSMRFVFDNSGANPENPHDPPQRVRFGARDGDEMAELILQVVPTGPEDAAVLRRSISVKATRDDILGYQARVRTDPTDHHSRTQLAARYLEIGEADVAVDELREAIAIAPDDADAWFLLGVAHGAGGETEPALEAYREAIRHRPDFADAHNNLGALLEGMGESSDALAHYRLATRFEPRHRNAQYNLAQLLHAQGEADQAITAYERVLEMGGPDAQVFTNLARIYVGRGELRTAIAHYRRALDTDPTHARAMVDLAWVLSTAPAPEDRDPREALTLVQRAATLIGRDDHPLVLDVLAAAYAADGRFERAVTTARQAAEQAAVTPGFESLAPAVRSRIRLYLAFRPFRMVTPAVPVRPRG